MHNASEGKPRKDSLLECLSELDHQVEQYSIKRDVPGLIDVMSGLKVLYPTTIYQTSGDDTSGVAGMLMADGEFVAAALPKSSAEYWEFDETLAYNPVLDEEGNQIHYTDDYNERFTKVAADSWTEGEVVWDGSVTNSVNPFAIDGDEKGPVNRREWDVALTGEWETTGELWKAIERGTSMLNGPKSGTVHVGHLTRHDENENNLRKAA